MNYTDEQLKRALAKMLPEKVGYIHGSSALLWRYNTIAVLDTELLHLCWLVEETLTKEECYLFQERLAEEFGAWQPSRLSTNWIWHASWQQRAVALAKVKGVEIV